MLEKEVLSYCDHEWPNLMPPTVVIGPSLVAQMVECLPTIQETQVRSLGWGRSPGEGNGNPTQYSCLENSMDGGAWWATVHGVTKSRKQLSDFTSSLHFTVVIMSYQGDRDLRGKFQ